jgi:putative ABC transport system permease protein
VIAVLATSLVFGMTLLMTGADVSLHNKGRRIVAALGADAWLVADGASGPFTTSTRSLTPTPTGSRPPRASSGPICWVILHSALRRPFVRDVNVIGTRPGLGAPPLVEGHDQSQEGGLSLRSLSGMMACSSDDQHKAERERITCPEENR